MLEQTKQNVNKQTILRYNLLAGVLMLGCIHGPLAAQPAPKVVFPAVGLTTPIGIAYSPFVNKLLVTQPFCGTAVGSNVTGYNVTAIDSSGNSSLFANLGPQALSTNPAYGHNTTPFNSCFEDYIAVSPGLGGFPLNQVYVTQGQTIVSIPPGGGAPTTFVTGLPTTDTETSISFDTVGTFCNNMIITSADGRVSMVDSAGNVTLYATITSAVATTGGVAAEGAVVAPLTLTPYGGWLMVAVEDTTNVAGPFVAAIQPPTKVGNTCSVPVNGPTIYRIANQPSPETVLSVPSTATSCEFGTTQNGSFVGGSFFSVTYTGTVNPSSLTNPYQIVAYRASGFGGAGEPHTGDIMVPNEDQGGTPTNYLHPGGGGLGTMLPVGSFDVNTFVPKFVQQEGSTFVGCPQTLGCVLTPGGYKNHFNYKITSAVAASLLIGCRHYTPQQITDILSRGGGGINALGRSLTTAMLNQYYGAFVPSAVQDAIDAANKLICDAEGANPSNNIFNVSVPNDTASTLNEILDDFNNGRAPGGPTTECTR